MPSVRKEKRSPIINTSWGDVVEDNSFGTHEFFKLCELVGAAPYIAANITSGTVQELTDWVDYITNSGTSKMGQMRKENGREEPWELPYLGIGNENWTMRPEFYSDRFKLYASGLKGAGSIHQKITRIACETGRRRLQLDRYGDAHDGYQRDERHFFALLYHAGLLQN